MEQLAARSIAVGGYTWASCSSRSSGSSSSRHLVHRPRPTGLSAGGGNQPPKLRENFARSHCGRPHRPSPKLSACSVVMGSELGYDLTMGIVTMGGALGSLKFWDELAMRDVFPKKVSRKLVHISVGLIFMLFWPLFSESNVAPYIAASSPAINGLRMLAIGLGVVEDPVVVKAMTREGEPRELLKGPFYYTVTITLATTCLWRTSPLAPIIIANLCAGDGFADLVGRKFGNVKLPYNGNKSYIGSLAMLMCGCIFSLAYHYYFSSFGFYQLSSKLVLATFVASCVTTLIESLPVSTQLDDNLTVPLTSFIVSALLLSTS